MEEKEKIVNISVEDILPNRFQPRLAFDEKGLNELANSILQYGIIQPLVLRQIGEKYEIIAGERRYKASVLAGLKKVPAIIKNTDDNTSAEIALLENLQRKNLTPIEEAQSYKKLMDRHFTQEEIAKKLGISQSSIANKLRLLNLPKKVQDALLFNKISERHARSMLVLNDSKMQEELLEKIIFERLTVKQTEEYINNIINNSKNIGESSKIIEQSKDIKYNNNLFIEEENDKFEIDSKNIYQETPFEKEELPKEEKNINTILKYNPYLRRDNNYVPEVVNIDDKKDTKEDNNSFLSTPLNLFNKENNDKLLNIINDIKKNISKLNSSNNIKTTEIDLPNKYQIVIEIEKDNF